jgi:hypothetical protein
MTLRSADFESAASASSAIPAHIKFYQSRGSPAFRIAGGPLSYIGV